MSVGLQASVGGFIWHQSIPKEISPFDALDELDATPNVVSGGGVLQFLSCQASMFVLQTSA